MIKKIGTFMSVLGDSSYFKMALISIESFLKNNINDDLFIITDNISVFDCFKDYPRFHCIDVKRFDADHTCDILEPKMYPHILTLQCGNILYKTMFVTKTYYFAQLIANDYPNITHVLRIDCDSYFVGNMFKSLYKEINDSDVFMVERKHPAMVTNKPGAGFTLWRKDGTFINRFITEFKGYDQETVRNIFFSCCKKSKGKLLINPGYHVVYPFTKNPNFSKKDADQFIPAYFHLRKENAYENMLKLREWYHE